MIFFSFASVKNVFFSRCHHQFYGFARSIEYYFVVNSCHDVQHVKLNKYFTLPLATCCHQQPCSHGKYMHIFFSFYISMFTYAYFLMHVCICERERQFFFNLIQRGVAAKKIYQLERITVVMFHNILFLSELFFAKGKILLFVFFLI